MDGSTPHDVPSRTLDEARQVIARIADALDVPVAALYGDGELSPRLMSATELLEFWASLSSEPARARVLAAARAAAATKSN